MRWIGWAAATMEREVRAGAQYRYDDTALFGFPRFGRMDPATSNFKAHGIAFILHYLTKPSSTILRLSFPQAHHDMHPL